MVPAIQAARPVAFVNFHDLVLKLSQYPFPVSDHVPSIVENVHPRTKLCDQHASARFVRQRCEVGDTEGLQSRLQDAKHISFIRCLC